MGENTHLELAPGRRAVDSGLRPELGAGRDVLQIHCCRASPVPSPLPGVRAVSAIPAPGLS